MQKILYTFLLLLTLSTSVSFAYEKDKTFEECGIEGNNISEIRKQSEDCVSHELSQNTRQGDLMRRVISPSDYSATVEWILYLLTGFASLMIFSKLYTVYKLQSQDLQNEQNIQKSKMIFSLVIVLTLATIITSERGLQAAVRVMNDTFLGIPMKTLVSMIHVKETFNPVIDSTIEASMSQVQEKALRFNADVVNTEICAITYKQSLSSIYSTQELLEETLVQDTHDELNCIDDYIQANASKSFAEIGNTTLLSAAVRECSVQYGVVYKDCGGFKLDSSVEGLNKAFEENINEMVKFTNEYISITCEKAFEEDKEANGSYCLNYKNRKFEQFSSPLAMNDIYPLFNQMNVQAAERIKAALKGSDTESGIVLDDVESETKILSYWDLLVRFFKSNHLKDEYQQAIDVELNNINKVMGSSRNLENGYALKDREIDNIVILNANDFFTKINAEITVLFNSSSLVKSAMNDSLAFLKDYKLAFGQYTDGTATERLKTHFNILRTSDHYIETMALLMGIKVSSKILAKEMPKSAVFWNGVNIISNIAIIALNLEYIVMFFIFIMFLGVLIMKFLEHAVMFVLECGFLLVSKKEPEILLNRVIMIVQTLASMSYITILTLLRTTMFVSIVLMLFNYIPLAASNYIVTLAIVIIIKVISAIYLLKSLQWVGHYLGKILKTSPEGISGNAYNKLKKLSKIM
ncbi:hypothetical protein [Vibrio parahaemolyticus]|uniref:hypothetical protein n=1 Tax=Vibrio parahaemolyticus TaxID=670 RepID=UPI000C27C4FC|nr:hypothetical protein [Vibrio parahaemolyticus]PJN44079.1 hypothetical protein CNR26_20095 [Vibrio parahaemolyticus]